MKKIIKRLALMLVMIVSLATLSACSSTTTDTGVDPNTVATLTEASSTNIQTIMGWDDATIQQTITQAETSKYTALVDGLNNWLNTRDEVGTFKSIDKITISKSDTGYLAHVVFSGSLRSVSCVMGYNEDLSKVTQMTFNPVYSIGEKLSKAGLNMFMGMLTVFLVLIFISFLISRFKYIKIFEDRMKDGKKDKSVVDVVSETSILEVEEQEDTDDLELIAVITAAISAYTGTSSDGLVVRSIKRINNSSWKKA